MAKKMSKTSLITQFQPDSQLAEAYRSIRTKLKFTALDKGKKLILVTSSLPGEGKTTIAVNLAILSAQDGKRVLLIDGDLRRPNVHYIFNCMNRTGLSTILSGFADLPASITKTNIDNVDLLPAGPIQSRPAELLSSVQLDKLAEELSADYDAVFIDTPPLLTVTDAALLARIADCIVLVARSGLTKKDQIQKSQKALEPFHDKVAGIIFNSSNEFLEGLR